MSEEAIQDTGSQEVASEAVAQNAVEEVSFRDSLPENLRTAPGMLKFKDVPGLAQGYVNLESMIGTDKIGVPQDSWTDDQWSEFYGKTGRPSSAEQYNLDIADLMSEDDAANLRQAAFDAGLSAKQLSKLTQHLAQTNNSNQEQFETNADALRQQSMEELQKEFGQAFEQKAHIAANAGRALLGESRFDELMDTELVDGRQIGDLPEVVRLFSQVATAMGEDVLVGEATELIMTPEQAKQELKEIMRPGTPYMDAQHPEHDAYVQKVQQLFQAAS